MRKGGLAGNIEILPCIKPAFDKICSVKLASTAKKPYYTADAGIGK
jgi:hypothetical protein